MAKRLVFVLVAVVELDDEVELLEERPIVVPPPSCVPDPDPTHWVPDPIDWGDEIEAADRRERDTERPKVRKARAA